MGRRTLTLSSSTDRQKKTFFFSDLETTNQRMPTHESMILNRARNSEAKERGSEESTEKQGTAAGRPRGGTFRRRRRRGRSRHLDEPGGLRGLSGRGSRDRRRTGAAAVLLRHDDDDEALALVAVPGGAADEVVPAGARQRHGDVAGLVRVDGAGRAAAVVVVLADL